MMKKQELLESLWAFLFLFPGIFLFLFFYLYPYIYSFYLSLTDQSVFNLIIGAKFIGLENFKRLFNLNSQFYAVLLRTLIWVCTSVSLKVIFGLVFAVLFNSEYVLGKRILLPLMIIPWVIPGILTILTWRNMFTTEFGTINLILKELHFQPINWLYDTTNAFIAYNIVETWLAYPFMMTVILAAMKGIPLELYESAVIDGADWFAKLKNITLPLIRKPLLFATLLTTSTSFQIIMVPYLLNEGGPARTNEFFMVYGYKEAFTYGNFGYASAFVVVAFAIILAIGISIAKIGKLMEEA
jgi:arabinogalactan oligomer/maltooligosaccharide transport system permease protein